MGTAATLTDALRNPARLRMWCDLEKAEPENSFPDLLDAIRDAVGTTVDVPVGASQ